MAEQNAKRAEFGLDSEGVIPVNAFAYAIDSILYPTALKEYKKDHPDAVDSELQKEWFTIGAQMMLGACVDYYKYKQEQNRQRKSE